jgi:hypothetical protein
MGSDDAGLSESIRTGTLVVSFGTLQPAQPARSGGCDQRYLTMLGSTCYQNPVDIEMQEHIAKM